MIIHPAGRLHEGVKRSYSISAETWQVVHGGGEDPRQGEAAGAGNTSFSCQSTQTENVFGREWQWVSLDRKLVYDGFYKPRQRVCMPHCRLSVQDEDYWKRALCCQVQQPLCARQTANGWTARAF